MTLAVHDSALRQEIETFIKTRFGEVEIMSVSIDENFDRDGDRVLEITVNFKGTSKDLARKEPPGFIRGLQEMLAGMRETAFPIVSFRPASQSGALHI